jgi:molybdopterin synthase sulfur carrier subunit
MNITVKLFGQMVDVIGSNLTHVNNVDDTDGLIQNLQLKYPALMYSKYRVAVNRNIIQSNTVLQQDAEVALLPPFSGG